MSQPTQEDLSQATPEEAREQIRDALAEELLAAFGITVQDYQQEVADVFMERIWPMIATYADPGTDHHA